MEEKYLKSFIEVMPYLNDVMQDDIAIIVFDLRNMKIAAFSSGEQLKASLKAGDDFQKRIICCLRRGEGLTRASLRAVQIY